MLFNMEQMPKLDKRSISVFSLDETDEEKRYWLSKNAQDRIDAIELNRRMVYGHDRVTSRLQRFLETSELTRR